MTETLSSHKNSLRTLAHLVQQDLSGKRGLVRVDFNVPRGKEGITDDSRIRAALPTINQLRGEGAVLLLASHLGRPKGNVDETLRMAPIGARLSELINQPVHCLSDCIGDPVHTAVKDATPGSIFLLENLRFHPEEEANDLNFSAQLAASAAFFVNDAFGAAHRAHASTEGVAHRLPAYAGLLMEKEVAFLGEILREPKLPFVAILGGAKVSDKLSVIQNLLPRVDQLCIGGGMAYTFLKAMGHEIGTSLFDEHSLPMVETLLKNSSQKIVLPDDIVVADNFQSDAKTKIVPKHEIPATWMGLDIGPQTRERFTQVIASAQTVFWNGPMGRYEWDAFSQGTQAIAHALAASPGTTVVGGGESVDALRDVRDQITHISTGGGASLEFLEGKMLPGVRVLMQEGE